MWAVFLVASRSTAAEPSDVSAVPIEQTARGSDVGAMQVDPIGAPNAYAFASGLVLLIAVAIMWRRKRDVRRLERALFYEVRAMRCQAASMALEIARRHRAGEPFDANFFGLWRLSAPMIYPSVGFMLSRLPGSVIDTVGYFHAQLSDARARLAEARDVGRFEPTPYRMLSSLVRACYHAQPWCEALEFPGSPLVYDCPDLLEASSLLGEFERAGHEPVAVAYCWVDWTHPFPEFAEID